MTQHEVESIVSLTGRVRSLETGFQELKSSMRDDFSKMETAISGLTGAVHSRERTNWGLILSGLGVAAAMVTGFWAIISMKTETALAPVLVQNAVSTRDRETLATALRALQTETSNFIADSRATDATMDAKLREIETQFRASDEFRNMRDASTQRFLSLLWTRCYGEGFPDLLYFPHIATPK